jgi:hypothetical protein
MGRLIKAVAWSFIVAVAWGFIILVVVFVVFGIVKGACHECLALPVVAQCERSNNAVSVQVESNRAHGYIKQREFAGCRWYWHEANTGGN